MKLLLQLSLVWLLLPNSSFSINEYQAGDTLYVWAYHGLNMRGAPSPGAAKLLAIPYGAKVIVLDSIRVKSFSVKEYFDFRIKGHWSKVRFDTLEAWVFDGYLSRYPALRHVKQHGSSVAIGEDYLSYGSREWGLKQHKQFDLNKNTPPSDTLTRRDIYQFKNGAVYEIRRGRNDGGWVKETFTIPAFSFEEAFLFFIYNKDYFLYDPKYNPYVKPVPAYLVDKMVIQKGRTLTILWSLCEFTFEKRGKMMVVHWFCSC